MTNILYTFSMLCGIQYEKCWARAPDGKPTLNQYWFSVSGTFVYLHYLVVSRTYEVLSSTMQTWVPFRN